MSFPNINLESLKSMVDEAKNQIVPKTDVEKRMYEALSNKNWGASSTLMNQIAADTYDYEKYHTVMKSIWTSLDGPGRNWRSVFKALTLLDHLIKNGAERIVEDMRDHLHKIRTLTDFNYYEGSTDRGSGVREKAKQLIELLGENERIREEREKARRLRDKFVGIGVTGGMSGISGGLGGNSGGPRYDGFSAQDFHRDRFSDDIRGGGSRSVGGGFNDRPGKYTDTSSPSGGSGGGESFSRDRDYGNDDHRGGGYDRAGGRGARFDDSISPPLEEDNGRSLGNSLGGTRRKSRDKIEIRMKEQPKPTLVSPPTTTQAAAKTADLLGDDFFGGGGGGNAGGGGGFDAFGSNSNNDDGFDDFNPRGHAPAPAPAPAPAKDPFFGSPVTAPSASQFAAFAPPPPSQSAPAPFDPFSSPVPQQHSYLPQPPAPAPFNAMGGGSSSFPPPAPPSSSTQSTYGHPPQHHQHQYQQQQQQQQQPYGGSYAPARVPSPGGLVFSPSPPPVQQQQQQPLSRAVNDFGDFQASSAAPARSSPAPAKTSDMWGGLVDLGNLSIEDKKPKEGPSGAGSAANNNHLHQPIVDHVGFSDLDSFAKAKQGVGPGPIVGLGMGLIGQPLGGTPPKPMGVGVGGYGGPQPAYGSMPAQSYGQQQPQGLYGQPQAQQQQAPRGAYPPPSQQHRGYGAPPPQSGYGVTPQQNPYGGYAAAPPRPSPQQQHQQAYPGYPPQQQYGGYPPQQPPANASPFPGF